jgi:hypothetical protein
MRVFAARESPFLFENAVFLVDADSAALGSTAFSSAPLMIASALLLKVLTTPPS